MALPGAGWETVEGEPTVQLLVRQVNLEAADVISLVLGFPDGSELPVWEPGAHVDLVLPSGLIRQYSLCGAVEDRTSYRIAVLKEAASRGGSREIHERGLVGTELVVRGPRNHFHLTDHERFLFIAGGIGITPILPMLAEVERRGVPWHLVYGGRSRASMAFLSEIAERRGGSVDLVPEDELGYPDLDAIIQDVAAGTAVFSCGPAAMLNALEERCTRLLDPGVLHIERFGASAANAVAGEVRADDESFEVELARQGVVLVVPPDRSLLDVVHDVVPSVMYSCHEGYCGTCETKVLDGVPDHRDTILTESERAAGRTMMICVSRSKSARIVLDI